MARLRTEALTITFKVLAIILVSIGVGTDYWVKNDEFYFGLFTLCYTGGNSSDCSGVTSTLNDVSGK